jgi:hypothetical protein
MILNFVWKSRFQKTAIQTMCHLEKGHQTVWETLPDFQPRLQNLKFPPFKTEIFTVLKMSV